MHALPNIRFPEHTQNAHNNTRRQAYPELGVEVRRSSLNTPTQKRARAGYKLNIVEAGDGLFATRKFKTGEHILDYRYIHGVSRSGDEVEWLSAETFTERYAPSDGMPLGSAKYVLHPNGSPYYYDTA